MALYIGQTQVPTLMTSAGGSTQVDEAMLSNYVRKDDISLGYSAAANTLTLSAADNVQTVQLHCTESKLDTSTKNAMLAFCKAVVSAAPTVKDAATQMRATIINIEEFQKLGTGLFIHWGVYSVPAGRYTGEKQPGGTSTQNIYRNCEWSFRDLAIPRDTYKEFEKSFNTTKFDAEALVKKAHDAGMRYVIFTAKHHEGFSLYPTAYGNWDVRTAGTESAPCRTTIIDELKAACEKYEMKFGLYFSQYWDWMAEGGFGIEHGGKWNGTTTDQWTQAQHIEYCQKTILQLKEMFELYNPYVIWWDPGSSVASSSVYSQMFKDCLDTTLATCIHNDRLMYDRSYGGDFGTGERTIYLRNAFKYGEACFTMNSTWGYSINNENNTYYYTPEKIFKEFILYSLAYGQNCLMNVGPKSDGSIPERQLEFIDIMKRFGEKYGQFYGYKRVNYYSMPKWGYMLQFPDNTIVCYVLMPKNQNYSEVTLDCVPTLNLTGVDILTPSTSPSYIVGENKVTVSGLELDSDTKVGVVRLNYSMPPMCEDANLLLANELLPSRSCLMTSSNQTYDFTNLRFNLTPSKHIAHQTDFVWDGATDEYDVKLDYTCPADGDETTELTLKDITAGTDALTMNFAHGVDTSINKIELTHDHRYRVTFKVTGTDTGATFIWNGIKFTCEVVSVTGLTLNQTSVELAHDGTVSLFAVVEPSNATNKTVTWTIGDQSIATITDGVVTAVAAGETDITATTEDGSFTATCHVKVNPAVEDIVPVTGISLTEHTITGYVGESHQLTCEFQPANATDKQLIWTSNDESIATVTDGYVQFIAEGTASITVKSVDGDFTDTCGVTAQVVHVTGVQLDKSTFESIPGYGIQLSATVSPQNAYNKRLTWSVDDDSILKVDSLGNVTPLAEGTANAIATTVDGSFTAACQFTVTAETYDYVWEHDTLAGTEGEDATIDGTIFEPFSDENQHWTIFSWAQNSKNPNADKNATLYQCVVNASPWTGLRIDADNAQVLNTSSNPAPIRPRFVAGMDVYFNTEDCVVTGGSIHENANTIKHPFAFSRDGSTYSFSFDGVTWTVLDKNTPYGLQSDTVIGTDVKQSEIARLKACNAKLTVGMDYKRASGSITTTKYRMLQSDYPTCVSIKKQSNYRFHTMYTKYNNIAETAVASE